MPKQKYYAVHNGREGTQIYLTWDEVRPAAYRSANFQTLTTPIPLSVQAKANVRSFTLLYGVLGL